MKSGGDIHQLMNLSSVPPESRKDVGEWLEDLQDKMMEAVRMIAERGGLEVLEGEYQLWKLPRPELLIKIALRVKIRERKRRTLTKGRP